MLRVRVCRGDETAEFGGDGRVFDLRGGGVRRIRGVFVRKKYIYVLLFFLKKRRRQSFRRRRLGGRTRRVKKNIFGRDRVCEKNKIWVRRVYTWSMSVKDRDRLVR